MLELQETFNKKVFSDWEKRNLAWFRAIWIECAEFVDHAGYKWWRDTPVDRQQLWLEVVDIWHFGMSALLEAHPSTEATANFMCEELHPLLNQSAATNSQDLADSIEIAEELAIHALQEKVFSIKHFYKLMGSVAMNLNDLHRIYIGKNVLNRFRQDYGYREGNYHKLWKGREDNLYLVDIAASLEVLSLDDFPEQLYLALKDKYLTLTQQL